MKYTIVAPESFSVKCFVHYDDVTRVSWRFETTGNSPAYAIGSLGRLTTISPKICIAGVLWGESPHLPIMREAFPCHDVIFHLSHDIDCVSNHHPHDCLLKRLFMRRSKKTSKLRVTGLCAGIHRSPVNSLHKGPVTRKIFPFDEVIMIG